jgi:hypothetical protein
VLMSRNIAGGRSCTSDGWPRPPGRAPPVPRDGPAQPAAGGGARARLLRGAGHLLHRDTLVEAYRHVLSYLNDVGRQGRAETSPVPLTRRTGSESVRRDAQ